MFKEEATQLVFMQTLYPGRIGIWRCGFFLFFFVDERKPETQEENP